MDNKTRKNVNTSFSNFYNTQDRLKTLEFEIHKQQEIKQIIANTFANVSGVVNDDMPHAHNNCEADMKILNSILKKDAEIAKIDKEISRLQSEMVLCLRDYNNISDFIKTLNNKEMLIFEMLYNKKMTAIDIAFNLRYTSDRYVYKIKSNIIVKYINFVRNK